MAHDKGQRKLRNLRKILRLCIEDADQASRGRGYLANARLCRARNYAHGSLIQAGWETFGLRWAEPYRVADILRLVLSMVEDCIHEEDRRSQRTLPYRKDGMPKEGWFDIYSDGQWVASLEAEDDDQALDRWLQRNGFENIEEVAQVMKVEPSSVRARFGITCLDGIPF